MIIYYCRPYLWSFRRTSQSNRQKLQSSTATLSFEVPAKRNPREYSLIPYISRNSSHWPTFLLPHAWVYLHSNLCSGLQKTHLFCTRVCFGRSRSFRVIQCRWFWYQSKARIRLPISRSLWLRSYLAPFLRYSDLLVKNCLFLLPLSHLVPLLPMFPLEFRTEVNPQETSHAAILQWRPQDRSWSHFGMIPACDGWSDRGCGVCVYLQRAHSTRAPHR